MILPISVGRVMLTSTRPLKYYRLSRFCTGNQLQLEYNRLLFYRNLCDTWRGLTTAGNFSGQQWFDHKQEPPDSLII